MGISRWYARTKECTWLGVKDIPTLLNRITRIWTNKVILVPVESWNNNMLNVQTWLVVATRPQARYLSFRLRNSSNTPSVGMSVIIGFSGQFQWKGRFPYYNPGWRSTWANRHNSRQDYNLGSSSTIQKRTGGWFSNNTSGKEIGDHGVTWQDDSRFCHVKTF
jgi:hypothetical protein